MQDDGDDIMDGNADDENDEQEQEGGEDLHEEQEPQSREDMRQIQARFKNNRRTAAHSQRYVQIEMRMIYLGAQPLFEEYQKALEEQKEGQVS